MKFKSVTEFDAVYDALGQYVETCKAADHHALGAADEYQAFPHLQAVEVLLMDMDARLLAHLEQTIRQTTASRETIKILMRRHQTLRLAAKRRGIEATLTTLAELTSILNARGVLYLGGDHYHNTNEQGGHDGA